MVQSHLVIRPHNVLISVAGLLLKRDMQHGVQNECRIHEYSKGNDRGGIILIILQVIYWQQLQVVFHADGGLRLSGANRTANARPGVRMYYFDSRYKSYSCYK